ncbi:hypothetical protein PIB30_067072 [Stylosanthes scabra]|uniref:Uncharacterized protein n=1 Tax=Stylosanthes scabra TaxID=79078 RepID=A0ABU6ZLA3_9FABA|nr:hypothetical protein [Stylosanthes scabra]
MAMLDDPGKMAPRAILPIGAMPASSSPKRKRNGGKGVDVMDRVLGEDAAWEHLVNPLDLAFPKGYNFRKALDAGLTSASVRKPLQTMPSDQLLGESWRLSCKSLACLQVGLETALAAKTKAEEELLAAQGQVALLKVERDSALTYLPLKEKVDTLNDELSMKEGEHQSALELVTQLEEDIKVLQTERKSCRSSLEQEQKRAEVAEKKAEELSSSHHKSQFDLGAATEMPNYWCTEWKKLDTDAKEMRIYVPEGASGDDVDMEEVPPEVDHEQEPGEIGIDLQPRTTEQVPQPEAGDGVDGGGECPT